MKFKRYYSLPMVKFVQSAAEDGLIAACKVALEAKYEEHIVFKKAVKAARRVKDVVNTGYMHYLDLMVILYLYGTSMCVFVCVNNSERKNAVQKQMEERWGSQRLQSCGLWRVSGSRSQTIDCNFKCCEFVGDEKKTVNVSNDGKCSFTIADVLERGGKDYIYLDLEIGQREAHLQLACCLSSGIDKKEHTFRYNLPPLNSGGVSQQAEEAARSAQAHPEQESSPNTNPPAGGVRITTNISSPHTNLPNANVQTLNSGEMETHNTNERSTMTVQNPPHEVNSIVL